MNICSRSLSTEQLTELKMGSNVSFHDRIPINSSMMAGTSSSSSSRNSQLFNDYDTVIMREKKKKASKFATLRKKLTRHRRHSRSYDYVKALRDLTSGWSTRELHSLCDEYDTLSALKDLTIVASLARPSASTILEDLAALFENKYCTDVDLVYQDIVFPAHRAILCIRCALFRELLSNYPNYGSQVPVVIQTLGVDVNLFLALLRFLYTGDFGLQPSVLHNLKKILNNLASEFGAPNNIEQDLRTLLDTGAYCDAILFFSSNPVHELPPPIIDGRTNMILREGNERLITERHSFDQIRCHWAILAARSAFFRNLFFRRAHASQERRSGTTVTPIVLDEKIIPKRYASVLLNAIYLDIVDLTFILHASANQGALADYQALPLGTRLPMTSTEEAMDLYHIGQFLDFMALSQGCEDIIAESIMVDNLVPVIKWSSKPHGSEWVHRQAIHFLEEEFLQVAHSQMLSQVDKDLFVDTISSDFLQASELDVLVAVIKWGEQHLVKRIEEREPNQTTQHSVSKKGTKKRDLNDVELRDVLAELLPHLRTDHIIPANSDIFINAIKRGLVSVPPSQMFGPDTGHSNASAWVRTKNAALFVKPRLFTPFFEEVRLMIKEQNIRGPETNVSSLHYMHTCAIPDALYMLDEQSYSPWLTKQWLFLSSTVDVIAGIIPIPDKDVVHEMRRREAELIRYKLAQRAYSMISSDKLAITRQIQLRVVREFGLPDSAVEVLHGSIEHVPHRQDMCLPISGACCLTPFQGRSLFQFRSHLSRQLQPPVIDSRCSPKASPTSVRQGSRLEMQSESRDESPKRNMMPDVAMATASVSILSVDEDENPADLHLDLGDGANHSSSSSSAAVAPHPPTPPSSSSSLSSAVHI